VIALSFVSFLLCSGSNEKNPNNFGDFLLINGNGQKVPSGIREFEMQEKVKVPLILNA
jgi:hypothetical protein